MMKTPGNKKGETKKQVRSTARTIRAFSEMV
jgi:hypothetical protein